MQAIMVAEDDEPIRDLIKVALEEGEDDWVVTAVADGAALLAEVDSVVPALIILDVGMPGIDGIQAYRLLREREHTRGVPVLFVTATPDRVHDSNLSGPFACLPKPFYLDDLLGHAYSLIGSASG